MVKIKNVYWMLAYAFDMLKEKGAKTVEDIGTWAFMNCENLPYLKYPKEFWLKNCNC